MASPNEVLLGIAQTDASGIRRAMVPQDGIAVAIKIFAIIIMNQWRCVEVYRRGYYYSSSFHITMSDLFYSSCFASKWTIRMLLVLFLGRSKYVTWISAQVKRIKRFFDSTVNNTWNRPISNILLERTLEWQGHSKPIFTKISFFTTNQNK